MADTEGSLYGLNYDSSFLDSLPSVDIIQDPMPSTKIRTLSATQFESLQHQHVLSHPPDSVLFPFLHGIEGDNEAQNLFFATQGQQAVLCNPEDITTRNGFNSSRTRGSRTKVPKYRGLMWVICEEDLESPEKDLRVLVHRPSDLASSIEGRFGEGDDGEGDSSESYFDEDDELDDDDDDDEDDTSSESFGDPVSPSSTSSPYVGDPLVRPGFEEMDVDIAYTDAGDDVQDSMQAHTRSHEGHEHGVVEIVGVGTDGKHMHPVQHRVPGSTPAAAPMPMPIRTSGLTPSCEGEGAPSASTSMTSMTSEWEDVEMSGGGYMRSGRERSVSSPPTLVPSVTTQTQTQTETPTPRSPRSQHKHNASSSSRKATQAPPPILTSSFRVRDLLRRVPGSDSAGGEEDDGDWEFVPLRVPEGISLRNFGIQVPILASLSDIVIYSPTPHGAARSGNAVRLAKRFVKAVERKWRERVGGDAAAEGNNSNSNERGQEEGVEDGETPLRYNVFLLDATAEEMRKEMSHLVVRLCMEGDVPGSLGNGGRSVGKGGGAENENHVTQDKAAAQTDGDIVMYSTDSPHADADREATDNGPMDLGALPPNTVDFAQRERDEMRDLTRASEIVSIFPEGHRLAYMNPETEPLRHSSMRSEFGSGLGLRQSRGGVGGVRQGSGEGGEEGEEVDLTSTKTFWDPSVGQVFLGNANDVPLPVDGVGEFGEGDGRYCAFCYCSDSSGGCFCIANEVEGEKDSWTRACYPPGNSPEEGYGYDVCIECHDYAPFPTTAHLVAAEEKVKVLEERWRKSVEMRKRRRKSQRESSQCESEDTGSTGNTEREDSFPPRPPPHPNSIIHLPMPSSPPSTTATMNALMPVVRFLQKCLMPPESEKPGKSDRGGVDDRIQQQGHQAQGVMSRTMEIALGLSGDGDGTRQSSSSSGETTTTTPATTAATESKSRRWSSVSSLIPSFPSFPIHSSSSPSAPPPLASAAPSSRLRSFTSPAPQASSSSPSLSSNPTPPPPPPTRTRSRPLKILLYSSDGYTESSVPALCLLMAIKGLNLPRAYLELQVGKRRSFFVYQGDLGVLRRVEGVIGEERRERERERMRRVGGTGGGVGTHMNPYVAAGTWGRASSDLGSGPGYQGQRNGVVQGPGNGNGNAHGYSHGHGHGQGHGHGHTSRPAAKSVSFAQSPLAVVHPGHGYTHGNAQGHANANTHAHGQGHQRAASEVPTTGATDESGMSMGGSKGSNTLPLSSSVPSLLASEGVLNGGVLPVPTRRPRANTSPWLPSLFGGDHQSWFNDPRFDGSFPSRVLPFLYLGNLAHASNVYMLQALGITHVVSVGECALIPPSNVNMHYNHTHNGFTVHNDNNNNGSANTNTNTFHIPGRQAAPPYGSNAHYVPGKTPNHQGSLWIEERAGRIKVLDIQGVCDDGIDTLEPQLEPICEWIDQARKEGGQVLVHCRVGVSRSATVTIAYVMKHLSLPLVDAYLIVRSRRLSVLIQPNMRLLYNLLGWEIKLAKERACGDEGRLKRELASALSWPYLAKEVHALNEKYLVH